MKIALDHFFILTGRGAPQADQVASAGREETLDGFAHGGILLQGMSRM